VGKNACKIAEGALDAGMSLKDIRCFLNKTALHKQIPDLVRSGDVILLKASRKIALETVADEGYLNNPYRSVRYIDNTNVNGYSYEVEVYSDRQMSQLSISKVSDEGEVNLGKLARGTYYWRARAT